MIVIVYIYEFIFVFVFFSVFFFFQAEDGIRDLVRSRGLGDVYKRQLRKFKKTNQSTCINLRPIVVKGQRVSEGEVLCEGYGTEGGELALGTNLKAVSYTHLTLPTSDLV